MNRAKQFNFLKTGDYCDAHNSHNSQEKCPGLSFSNLQGAKEVGNMQNVIEKELPSEITVIPILSPAYGSQADSCQSLIVEFVSKILKYFILILIYT